MAKRSNLIISADDKARFWAKVERRDDGECWPWLAWTLPSGRGQWNLRGRKKPAPQWALVLSGTERPKPDAWALHSCDNPNCCNPKHLRWGTRQDNLADMRERNRFARNVGEANKRSPFTADDVRAIRLSQERNAELARRLGVTATAIYAIRARKSWAHIE